MWCFYCWPDSWKDFHEEGIYWRLKCLKHFFFFGLQLINSTLVASQTRGVAWKGAWGGIPICEIWLATSSATPSSWYMTGSTPKLSFEPNVWWLFLNLHCCILILDGPFDQGTTQDNLSMHPTGLLPPRLLNLLIFLFKHICNITTSAGREFSGQTLDRYKINRT